MTSNTSQWQSTTCSSSTNPNLNIQAWLGNIEQFFDDPNSSSQPGIAGAKPPNARPLQSTSDRSLTPTALYPVTEPQWAASSSSFIPSESDSPPQVATIISPHSPAEVPLVQHTRSHNNFCYSENVPSLYEWVLAPQDGFYFVMVESMTREDVEYNFCAAMDARHLLSLDKSILEAQIALDLLHLQSKFHDLWQLNLSISKSQDASQRILGYCKKKDVKLDFITLECFRPDHAQLNQSKQKKCKALDSVKLASWFNGCNDDAERNVEKLLAVAFGSKEKVIPGAWCENYWYSTSGE
ncbi:uncharacterized protein LACBIDRAFT_320781 [Laccaria bicolor S238N-H82]|uniref:Predicted protein n=1 Tax=Laccaria bicolor (strain S238N-H82 / ATCC MYA-4686) TaxID=486041 RepID=B0CR86_LACBS|nr:uncharacterized protein LACBIDRAFT_320781 [Laccaria bicolor S238N-H82]EDR15159.1 predicted protein [Laccaria bicolor S238N-H82]|eukprot:XP_001873367.1 predicted protein [Laccaria bicolor S238N-H82]